MIYMAAGNSRRFGNENKLLQNWKGKPLYLHTFEKLLRIREKEPEKISLTVVTQYPEIYREVQNQPGVNAVFCKESRLGVSYTIKAGIRAVGEIYDSVKKKICPVQEAHDFVRKEHCFVKNESSFECKNVGLSDVHSCRSAELKQAEHRSTDWGSRPAIQTGIYFAAADVLSVLWGKSRQSLYVPGRSDPGTDAAGRR